MEGSSTTGIITGILTFLGGTGFAKLVDFLRDKNNKKYLEKLSNNLQDLSTIYRVLEQMLDYSTATRVLVWKASNGGGTPKPGSEMFIKLLYATTSNDDINIYEKYNSVKVDGQYVDLLIDMHKNGFTTVTTKEMPNCLLKRLFLAEEHPVEYSEMYFLGNTESEIYYCTISTSVNEERFLEANKRVAIELGINDLKKVFKKHM